MSNLYYVYILSNQYHSVLYTGVTNNLERRAIEHLDHREGSFTARYNLRKLLYYEIFPTPGQAIAAEKKIKKWPIWKKRKLIEYKNPAFIDLLPSENQ